MRQLLEEEAAQRLEMCQKQDQRNEKEMEKLTEEMLKHQVAEKNTEAANTKARPGQILLTPVNLKIEIQ